MSDADYFAIILTMGLVTYLPRWMPLYILSHRSMPRWLVEWLDLVPVAILSALVFPEIWTSGTPRELDLFQARSLAAVPTLIFAYQTRSLGGTVLVGMLLYWVLQRF
ncbi:MAG: AzlD domain-containing protein [Syntrophobacteraceae bacterium]|jgi:branched-subunit amino acid transport protein|nr:AzlD domain-containing protein [Syntrophobacteraceae bacterium]